MLFGRSGAPDFQCREPRAVIAASFMRPIRHGGDLKRGTLRAIISQAGLTVAEFISLL
jgi:hypothetical protein